VPAVVDDIDDAVQCILWLDSICREICRKIYDAKMAPDHLRIYETIIQETAKMAGTNPYTPETSP
jgi:hypothetical protein